MRLPPLLIDFVFKFLFTSDRNSLNSLLSHILYPDRSNSIEVIEILSSENSPSFQDAKNSFLDLKAKDKEGFLYQIELQVAEQVSYTKRSLYYASTLIHNQLKAG